MRVYFKKRISSLDTITSRHARTSLESVNTFLKAFQSVSSLIKIFGFIETEYVSNATFILYKSKHYLSVTLNII